jgi:hypothetical protein
MINVETFGTILSINIIKRSLLIGHIGNTFVDKFDANRRIKARSDHAPSLKKA